jgi:diaminohydroxyphosphoribosylaminopyrimidine deaminase/5-amino-6-(5-phosphoribosylamino)uracil reductase
MTAQVTQTMSDADYIRRSIELARRGTALPVPAQWWSGDRQNAHRRRRLHTFDGIEHAEVLALRQAGEASRGSTVYTAGFSAHYWEKSDVPAQALIDAGVSRVVSAIEDPDPRVNGKGFAMLRNAGIAVESDFAAEAARMNEAFLTQTREKRPFGILKIAMTLDEKSRHPMASPNGSLEESRAAVQDYTRWMRSSPQRNYLTDKPQLTDRTAPGVANCSVRS